MGRLVKARRLLACHGQVGPAACRPYRQPVVGAWLPLPWVMSRTAWQQCRAGRGTSAWYAALWPRSALDSGVAGCTVAMTRLVENEGANFEGTRGRLLGVGPLHGRLLDSAAFWQPAVWTSRAQEGGPLSLMLEGCSRL